MDTLIERKKRFTPRRIYGGAGVLFILVFVFYFIFRDTGSSMTIDKSRITIATVTENEFNDYVRVICDWTSTSQPHDLPRCYRRRKSGGTPS